MPIMLPTRPRDGKEVKVNNKTFRWNQSKSRWEMI
jgi:hypothetical protein